MSTFIFSPFCSSLLLFKLHTEERINSKSTATAAVAADEIDGRRRRHRRDPFCPSSYARARALTRQEALSERGFSRRAFDYSHKRERHYSPNA